MEDFKEFINEMRILAEQGNIKAQHNLALCYYTGQGIQQNYQSYFRAQNIY